MVRHKIYYQKSFGTGFVSDSVCLWDETGNQYIKDIIYTQNGTRTDLLQFYILPSKRSAVGDIEPHIRHIVYIEYPSGARLPFMIVKTEEDIYNGATVYCASQGYLMTLSSVGWWTYNNKGWNTKKKVHTHLRWMMESCIVDQDRGTTNPFTPYEFAASQMNADGEATVEAPEREESTFNTFAEVFDKMTNDLNYQVKRVSSAFETMTGKWTDTMAVGSVEDLADKRPVYLYTDINIITSYKKTKTLDDYHNGAAALSKNGYGNMNRRGPVRIDHILTYRIPEDSDSTNVTATMNNVYNTTLGNEWIKTEIEVNPILAEPSTTYLRMHDVMIFENCGVANGQYIITGITRYIDNPSKTKFKLTPTSGRSADVAKYDSARFDMYKLG